MPKLTKRYIEALPVCDKESFVWDDILERLWHLRCPNAGQAFRKRKMICIQIGCFEALPFEQVKEWVHQAIADKHDSRNPDREKKIERLSLPVAQLAEWFLEEYISEHCRWCAQVEYRHAVNHYILLVLGSLKVMALVRDEFAKLH